MKEMSKEELQQIEGGFVFLRLSGFFDGVKGNTELWILGFKII
ncbi:MAG: bacteriocin [Mangrovibacterium sp.]